MGIFAAIPLGSLQIAAAHNASILQTILIFPTFLGPFCVRSRAFENLLNSGLNVLQRFTASASPLEEKRKIILEIGEAIYKKLPFLSAEIQDQLHELIKPASSRTRPSPLEIQVMAHR